MRLSDVKLVPLCISIIYFFGFEWSGFDDSSTSFKALNLRITSATLNIHLFNFGLNMIIKRASRVFSKSLYLSIFNLLTFWTPKDALISFTITDWKACRSASGTDHVLISRSIPPWHSESTQSDTPLHINLSPLLLHISEFSTARRFCTLVVVQGFRMCRRASYRGDIFWRKMFLNASAYITSERMIARGNLLVFFMCFEIWRICGQQVLLLI